MQYPAQCIPEDPTVLRGEAIGLEGDHEGCPLPNSVYLHGPGIVGHSFVEIPVHRGEIEHVAARSHTSSRNHPAKRLCRYTRTKEIPAVQSNTPRKTTAPIHMPISVSPIV